jgi:hypothetical protein
MTKSSSALLLALLLSLAALAIVPGHCAAVKYKTSGTYVDSAGGQHPWNVNDAHALVWDGRPYVPVGVSFVPRGVVPGASDSDHQADLAALDAIKSSGIVDVLLKAPGPITATDPAAWQKIIDYLDANGFTYGIEMSDGPKDTLRGYLVSPNRYRLEGPTTDATITFRWPDVDSAIYVVVNRIDNSVKATGGAVVKDGKTTIRLSEPLTSGQILLIYPRKTPKDAAGGAMGDIWSGFGEYRDRVTDFLKKIKLGPGMRFFLEPFTCKMDFTGDMIGFVPDSSGFRLGLEAYLTKKYVHEGSLNSGWGLNDNLASIQDATRLLPLWSMGRGISHVYDRASAKLVSVDPSVTRIWRDIIDYRDTSAQEYMNTIADTLRKQVANVPVIFRNSGYHRVYANPYGMGGFDGLGATAYGVGESAVINAAGPAYSLAEECGKSTWLVALAAGTEQGKPGYPGENALLSSLDSLREVGCKAFFIDNSEPALLNGLVRFRDRVKPVSIADYKPAVVSYPIVPSTGARVKRLARDTWWLPTLRMGSTTFIGDGLSAYSMVGDDRIYMWSSIGNRTITLKEPPTGLPRVEFPAGASVSKVKGGLFRVTLSDVPTVLRGMEIALVFPVESAEMEMDRLAAAILEADKAGLSVKDARERLDRAKTVLKNGQALTAYGIAQQSLRELLVALGADVWMEGELSPANNFDGVYPMQGASGNLALVLDTAEDAPVGDYSATYTFDAPSNSSYEVWIAGTPPADGSPMSYSIEDSPWTPLQASERAETYAPGLAWYRIGVANLGPGRHALKLRADGRRSHDNRYYFAVDAIVLSPRGFKPNGVMKPY